MQTTEFPLNIQFPYYKEEEMNRAELIAKMALEAGISKAKAELALGAFVDGIAGALKDGGKVSLVGFGTFSVSDRAARVGRNPRTGANINIPASKVPKFKAG